MYRIYKSMFSFYWCKIFLSEKGTGPEGLKEHCIMVNADRFVLVDAETNIPTGKLEDVGGTYYDLRVPRPFEKILNNVPGGGYDHTFCLTKGGAKRATTFSARLVHPPTGRYLEVYTDNPGLHIYTADKLPNPDRPLDLLSPSVLGLNVFRVAELDEFDGEYSEELERRWPEGDWPRPASAPEEEHVFPTYSQTMVGRDGEALGPEDGGEGEDDYPQHLLSEGESIVEEQWEDVWVPPKEIDGKMGCTYRNHGAVCLMPGEYPNAVNNKRFPSPVVYPGEMYKRTLMYSFGIVKQKKQRKLSTIVEEIREKDIVQD